MKRTIEKTIVIALIVILFAQVLSIFPVNVAVAQEPPSGGAPDELPSPPSLTWDRTYAGISTVELGTYDSARSIVQTSDGGYALAGSTGTGNDSDFWLVKVGSDGAEQWNKTYGGPNFEEACSLVRTIDNGFAIAGTTWSETEGGDFWLVRVDSNGVEQWNNTYGLPGNDEQAASMVSTNYTGFVLVGTTMYSNGTQNFYAVRTDNNGLEQWSHTYAKNADMARSVVMTSDGGFAILGETWNAATGSDYWLVKTNSSGVPLWNNTYGGTNQEFPQSVVQTLTGEIVMAGTKYDSSYYNDVWLVGANQSTGVKTWEGTYGSTYNDDRVWALIRTNNGTAFFGSTGSSNNLWLVRIDSNHNTVFDQNYTTSVWEGGLIQTIGSGFAVASRAVNGDDYDFLLAVFDSSGQQTLEKTYNGGTYPYQFDNTQHVYSMAKTSDGGFALAGSSSGFNDEDFWLVKTDAAGHELWNKTFDSGLGDDYAESIIQTSDGGYVLAGKISTEGNGDAWVVRTNSAGELLWSHVFDHNNSDDGANSVVETADGFAIAGYASQGGEYGSYDSWLIRLNSDGSEKWSRTYDGGFGGDYGWFDTAYSLVQTDSGGFAVAGYATKENGQDGWLVITDSSGNLLQSKTYDALGTNDDDHIYSIIKTADGGYAMEGYASLEGCKMFWLVRTDSEGTMLWNQTYSKGPVLEDYFEEAHSLVATSDGGFALAGYARDSEYHNSVWVIDTDSVGSRLWDQTYEGTQDCLAYSIVQTPDGGFVIAGSSTSEAAQDGFMVKFGGPAETGINVQNIVDGTAPEGPWFYTITDKNTGNTVANFTLPAAGGTISIPYLGVAGGNYRVTEITKAYYEPNVTVNGIVFFDSQADVNLNAGDVANVVFINKYNPVGQGYTYGSLNTIPSDMTFPFASNKVVPVQSAWPIDKNTTPDSKLDLVVNKTMAVLVNVSDISMLASSQLTVNVTFDGVKYTDVTSSGSAGNRLIAVYPIMPNKIGEFTISGTYQVGSGPIGNLAQTIVQVRDTVVLKLVFAYFTPKTTGNYPIVDPNKFAQVVANITEYIRELYPVKQVIVNATYIGLAGNATASSQGGASNDMKYLANIAKGRAAGMGTDAIGVAIVPDAYFTYHKYPAGVVGAMVTPSVKACIVSENWYTAAAHEVAHVLYSVFYAKEYYSSPSLKGTLVSGVWADKGEWHSGWDVMDYTGPPGGNWIGNSYTYKYLFKNATKTIADPEIIFTSGSVTKDGTVTFDSMFRVTQGTPDDVVPGKYSLRFVDANGNPLSVTDFDLSFHTEYIIGTLPGQNIDPALNGDLEADTASFAFAAVIPEGTVTVQIVNMTDPQVPDGVVMAAINAESIPLLPPTSVSVTFTTNGLNSDAGTSTVLTIDGTAYIYSDLTLLSFNWAPGSTHTVTASANVGAGTGKRYSFTAWTNGDGLSSGNTYTVPSTDSTVTANYKTHYLITVNSPYDSPTASTWVDKGGHLTVSVTSPTNDNGAGTRYRCTGYTLDNNPPVTDGSKTYTFSDVENARTITFNWVAQYKLTAQTNPTGLSPAPSVTPTSADGFYDNGASVTLTANSVAGYAFNRWYLDTVSQPAGNQIVLTMNGPHTAVAYYDQSVSSVMKAYFTDTNFNPISSFDVMFTKTSSKVTTLTLTATHPATYYYAFDFKNNGPLLPSLTLTVNIPSDFMLSGSQPVQMDFTPVTYKFAGGILSVTIPNIASGQMFTLRVHLDYKPKGTSGYPANSPTTYLKAYTFATTVNGASINSPTVTAAGKKATAIGGFVIDTCGEAKSGLKVKVYSGTTLKYSTTVNGDGYYYVEVQPGTSYIIVIYNSNDIPVWIKTGITVAQDTYVPVDFTVLPIDSAIQGFLKDNNNNPVAGATVQYMDSKNNVIGSTVTSLGGYFIFRFYLPGTYIVKVIPPAGYSAPQNTKTVRVQLMGTVTANFNLIKT